MNTAQKILDTIGGNKFIAMTGATIYSQNNGQTLVAKFKGSRIANILYVTLNSNDLYDVKICKFQNMDIKNVAEFKDIFAENLKYAFENTTKLRISL